ncbi:glycosyltransferase family 4 protein [Bosea sp. BH3]|uniref:glycosyltransferase family 4 protein n=1 Tax=Bosea sp. BH3 TaxID=2871701 RepID=UPI0021CB34C2|nr:glycosyltransferase family 4 protein [Bosea sp. BH3]MCU4181256.1 glycosyltransferase family 4 protein [Bosea sp. BH3]
MRLLLACEFYHPSRGGVQEVMRQLAERFVAAGHDVTVCTTRLPERDFTIHNGVKIEEFDISGNRANGLRGDTQRYVDFLKAFDGDAILIKAAQQWTFDAAWPALDTIKARKVFIPCGFSGLYEPAYQAYFKELPAILAKFDRLIFYAERYRDVDFARAHGLTKLSFLPNGASEVEFAAAPAPGIRQRLGISHDALMIITVGTPINAKGHTELAEAFAKLAPNGRSLALVLNGQWPLPPVPLPEEAESLVIVNEPPPALPVTARAFRILRRARELMMQRGFRAFAERTSLWLYHRSLWILRGMMRSLQSAAPEPFRLLRRLVSPWKPVLPPKTIDDHIADSVAQPDKIVVKTNLPRTALVEAFFAADLFVFASNIEYSPLVLFEAGAAGLPYLTVPVGNADEIVRWTRGGEVCPAEKDERGYTRVDPSVLAEHVQSLLDDHDRRRRLGAAGRAAWRQDFNWAAIAPRYEAILRGDIQSDAEMDRGSG